MARLFYALILLFVWTQVIHAQSNFDISEDMLIETQWMYIHGKHEASQTVIHSADQGFSYQVYFKFDHQYSALLDNQRHIGKWRLESGRLYYNFNGIKEFRVAWLSENSLKLLYESAETGQTISYTFRRIAPLDSPFKNESNTLPQILVDESDKNSDSDLDHWWKKWWSKIFGREKDEILEPDIKVELVGGGYYGGINRIVKDYITIDNTGLLVKEMYTEHHGEQKITRQVDPDLLVDFMEFVSRKGFFDLPRIISCEDQLCKKRLHQKPVPVPLRLSITYGKRTNIISISIWGKDRHNIQYIDYPKDVDAIIFAIQNMAHERL